MNTQMIVVDDFYSNVDDIRNYVLTMDFSVEGNYPGKRTGPVTGAQFDYLKDFIEKKILFRTITYWPGDYNTSFQYTTGGDSTWVHHDTTDWAGVLYLTPDPVENSGTTLYSLRENGQFEHSVGDTDWNDRADYTTDLSKWKPEITVENRYNRLILYRGACYHRSTMAGFGDSKENGRLFQVFFFNTLW